MPLCIPNALWNTSIGLIFLRLSDCHGKSKNICKLWGKVDYRFIWSVVGFNQRTVLMVRYCYHYYDYYVILPLMDEFTKRWPSVADVSRVAQMPYSVISRRTRAIASDCMQTTNDQQILGDRSWQRLDTPRGSNIALSTINYEGLYDSLGTRVEFATCWYDTTLFKRQWSQLQCQQL